MRPALRRLKSTLRPYLMPMIKVLPWPVRKHLVKPGVIELTERRLSAAHGFDSPFEGTNIKAVVERLRHEKLDLSSLPSVFLGHLFSALRKDKGMSSAAISDLSYEAASLEVKLLSEREWMGLFQLCCMTGLYQLGYVFREKAIEHILTLAVYSKKYSKRYLTACLEKQNFGEDGVEHFVMNSELDEEERKRFLIFSGLLGTLEYKTQNLLFDKEYKSYLREKSVAIVGPSESSNEDATEIDSYDEVVRLNFSYSAKGCDGKFNGNKATITYFNGEQVRAFHNEANAILPESVKFACLKSNEFFGEVADNNSEVSIRRLMSFDGLVYNGILNMGPIAVLDMALHSSSPPKIYHMDLMLTVRRFGGYYPDSFGRDSDEVLVAVFNRSTVMHDPVTQYRIFQRMWKSGRVSGDKIFEEVMSLGCEEYMKQLQSSYSGIDQES